MIDDHIIDSMRRTFDYSYQGLKREWLTGQYERLRDCPSFRTCYTYREALNVLIKGPEHFDDTQLREMIEEELELEGFWKNR